MNNDVIKFCEEFDIVENAMQMRTLIRWNGRDLRERENLAEHTHLVTACAIKLYDTFVKERPSFKEQVDFEKLIRNCMLHDSLELLRGDILSVTKDKLKGLRDACDKEEDLFAEKIIGNTNETTKIIVRMADLMACYKFIEHELRFPSNDFALDVYKTTKAKFDKFEQKFREEFGFRQECTCETLSKNEFTRGYEADAGADIILKQDVMFMPMSSTSFSLKVKVTPKEGEMAILCSRSSAAAKGLIVAMCPIDPNYTGEVLAIVHNVSNSIIKYKQGEAFCQVVTIPFNKTDVNAVVKKEGKRSDGNLGSTGR